MCDLFPFNLPPFSSHISCLHQRNKPDHPTWRLLLWAKRLRLLCTELIELHMFDQSSVVENSTDMHILILFFCMYLYSSMWTIHQCLKMICMYEVSQWPTYCILYMIEHSTYNALLYFHFRFGEWIRILYSYNLLDLKTFLLKTGQTMQNNWFHLQ